MKKKSLKSLLFNRIARIYGLFFNKQKRSYRNAIKSIEDELDFSNYQSIVDVGCGTGALSVALSECGLDVTGIDLASKMLNIAVKKADKEKYHSQNIKYIHGNVLEGLPFRDKSFDVAVSSFVAHGFDVNERSMLYSEMKRVAKYAVVIFDYNERRSKAIDFMEWLEGGNYFSFIKNIKEELTVNFENIEVVNTGRHTAAYICWLL